MGMTPEFRYAGYGRQDEEVKTKPVEMDFFEGNQAVNGGFELRAYGSGSQEESGGFLLNAILPGI